MPHGPAAAFYAVPMESVTALDRPQLRRAAFLRRVLAFLVDGAVLAVLGFALLALASLLVGSTVRMELVGPAAPRVEVIGWRVLLNAVLLASLSAGYFVLSWTRALRSPGQALLRIGVEDADADADADADDFTPLPMTRALLRWALLGTPLGLAAAASVNAPLVFLGVSVASLVWFAVLLITTLFSRSGRGLHDRVAGSIVARRR